MHVRYFYGFAVTGKFGQSMAIRPGLRAGLWPTISYTKATHTGLILRDLEGSPTPTPNAHCKITVVAADCQLFYRKTYGQILLGIYKQKELGIKRDRIEINT